MGSKAVWCGEVGQGSTMKLIGNTLISFMLEGLCEGLVVGHGRLKIEKMLEVVMASGFSSPYYTFKGAPIARRDFDQHFSIDLLVKDQTLMLKAAASPSTPCRASPRFARSARPRVPRARARRTSRPW